ncbi:MAG: hypothetical protein U9N54_08430 [candidate division Zixibacteria bacterium]|nr:hypothetical protein [candidate division Zixibacteria bacterium]
MMLKNKIYIVIIISLLGFNLNAVEINEGPIQKEFRQSLNQPLFAMAEGFDDFSSEYNNENLKSSNKSTFKAAIYSLVLPGMGEYYLDKRAKAKYYFGVEAACWIAYFSYRTYGSWKKDDLIDYANMHANASLENKSDEFIDMVGFYGDIYQFNDAGRVGDRDRPYLADTPDNHWYWQSEDDQAVYRNLKNRSREAYRRSNFVLGVAIVNRIVSVVDAIRDSKRLQREIDSFSKTKNKKIKFDINPLSIDNQVRLTWYPGF